MPPPSPEQEPRTATPDGAMAHARSMSGTVVDAMPTLPPSAAPVPSGVHTVDMLWHEVVAGGGYTCLRLPRGARLRLVDRDGDACAGLVLHRSERLAERLNVADTVKVQWQAYMGAGTVLLSDMGRAMATIVEDTSGRHDAFCGTINRAAAAARYGDGEIDGPTPNGRDLFALALGKRGLERRDVSPNINLFKGVQVSDSGDLRLDRSAPAGSHVVLRCELDLIVTIVDVPHPLDDRDRYTVTPLVVTAWRGPITSTDDPFRLATPERTRAFLNTETGL